MTNHRDATGDLAHAPFRQIFADDAARTGDAAVYTAGDLFKKAYQVDTQQSYTLTAVGPTTWTADGLVPFWPIAQQFSGDYGFIQGGTQGIVGPGYNLSEGVLADACMCQLLMLMMGANTDDSASGLEYYLMTLSLLANAGGEEPWERIVGLDEVGIVKELGGIGSFSHNSVALGDLTLDAATTISIEVEDTQGVEGGWNGTVLCMRSVFIPTPS